MGVTQKHTISDLYQMQSLPLEVKVHMTENRLRQWVDHFGIDGVYVSFSGGKDSTVLLDIARSLYPDIKAVFVDTGLEYPEIRSFVKTFDNVEWLKPKMNFRQVLDKYGYPVISKEVSQCVQGARRYLDIAAERERERDGRHDSIGLGIFQDNKSAISERDKVRPLPYKAHKDRICGGGVRTAKIMGTLTRDNKIAPTAESIPSEDRSRYSLVKWKFLLDAPFKISAQCCNIMKKSPAHSYGRKSKRVAITGQMANESMLRKQQWLRNGCNGFDMKQPISNPLSFWTEQDVLHYIKLHNLPICSAYGDIVPDYGNSEIKGQMSMNDIKGTANVSLEDVKLKTTGCNRTGCMFCAYGCHLEKHGEGRFLKLKQTHPQVYEYIMRSKEKGGLGFKEVLDWLNEHGNLHIEY